MVRMQLAHPDQAKISEIRSAILVATRERTQLCVVLIRSKGETNQLFVYHL
jgi:hypothetical protein